MDNIERDDEFPIRITVQYYKGTTNGVLSNKTAKSIAMQLQKKPQTPTTPP